MAIGMIIDETFAKPQHTLDAKICTQSFLYLLARQAGVAVGIEQALLSRDEQASAVHINRPAFEDPVTLYARCGAVR